MKYKIKPVSKPRMTRSDKWKKRDCVVRYWEFKDEVKKNNIILKKSNSHIIFTIPMPKSWSEKKKKENNQKPHEARPDVDNLCKAIMDAVLDEDCKIWDIRITKLWGYDGFIEIK